jgi:hypothetical protein
LSFLFNPSGQFKLKLKIIFGDLPPVGSHHHKNRAAGVYENAGSRKKWLLWQEGGGADKTG